jgi:hypothetical protein
MALHKIALYDPESLATKKYCMAFWYIFVDIWYIFVPFGQVVPKKLAILYVQIIHIFLLLKNGWATFWAIFSQTHLVTLASEMLLCIIVCLAFPTLS